MVYVASLAPDGTSPTKITSYVVLLKIILIFIIIGLEAVVISIVTRTYGFQSGDCVAFTGIKLLYSIQKKNDSFLGSEILFSAVPDALTHLPIYRLFFVLYFLGIYIATISSCLYIFVSAVDSWIEFIPKLGKYRLQFCTALGVFLCVSMLPLNCQAGMVYG